MNYDTAVAIVKQFYSKANDPALTDLLNKYSVEKDGSVYYRPYIVTAVFFYTEQKLLVKADIASWQKNDQAIQGLLNTQKTSDAIDGLDVPDAISPDSLNAETPPASNDNSGLGFMLIG